MLASRRGACTLTCHVGNLSTGRRLPQKASHHADPETRQGFVVAAGVCVRSSDALVVMDDSGTDARGRLLRVHARKIPEGNRKMRAVIPLAAGQLAGLEFGELG